MRATNVTLLPASISWQSMGYHLPHSSSVAGHFLASPFVRHDEANTNLASRLYQGSEQRCEAKFCFENSSEPFLAQLKVNVNPGIM